MIVGIDVSKDKLDVKVLPLGKYFQIQNTEKSIKSFIQDKLLKLGIPELVVFESTGGYEKMLMLSLMKLNLEFHRAHPNRVYHFAKAKGYFAKTDRIDAGILAQYGQQEEIVAGEGTSIEELKMQEISSRRNQLKMMISQEKNRLHATYLNNQIARSIRRTIKQLEKELSKLSEQLEVLISADGDANAKRNLLETIPGVGKEISSIIVTDLPELGKLSREQISNLVGVAPQTRDSGKKQGYRRIGKGRSHVRKALYMSALVSMRHNAYFKPMYERLIARGKKPKVALVALMRKMVITMNAMVRDGALWQISEIPGV